jgi:hypothetical protein
MELAIPHRLKRGPFTDGQMSMASIENQMEQASSEYGEDGDGEEMVGEGEESAVKKKAPR